MKKEIAHSSTTLFPLMRLAGPAVIIGWTVMNSENSHKSVALHKDSLIRIHYAAGCAPCKRAMHFFSEYSRVLQGIELWKAGNLEAYGVLMNQSSHSSLHNYEV